jgi:hypothetical protein
MEEDREDKVTSRSRVRITFDASFALMKMTRCTCYVGRLIDQPLTRPLTLLHIDHSLPVTQPYPDHVHILPSDSLPFFFVTTTQRVPTRSHSFFPSIYLSYCTDLCILLHCSFTYLCISTGCESSLRVNVLANIPDLRATSSTPVSISSDSPRR